MNSTLLDRRELRDLWVSIAIALSLAAYHLCFNLVQAFQYLSTEYARLVNNMMFLWILGLLWVAYRRYLDALTRQHDLHNVLTSISTEVIMVVDIHRRIEMVNETISMFGYKIGEVIKKTTDLLYFDRRADKARPHEVRDAIESVGFHVGQALGRKRDGTTFPIEIVSAALKGRSGAVLLVKDITERKRAEESILRAKERAEAADAAKSRMLAEVEESYEKLREMEGMRDNLTHMIVHDMRTPLQVVLSSLELLEQIKRRNPASGPDEARMLSQAVQQSRRLADLANAVLDVSRLESNRFPLTITSWDLVDLADECIAASSVLFDDLRVRCERNREDIPVEADREVIRRVIGNLLHNALKYSPPGSEVTLSLAADHDHVGLYVKDCGPGLAPEDAGKVFDKFAQGGNRPLRKMHGAGIGLAFCRLAVRAHGGSIGVTSELGKGATFWFRLPFKAAAPAAAS